PGQMTSSIAYGGSTCEAPRSVSCMIDTWGCTPSAQAYDSPPGAVAGTTVAIAGSGSAMLALVGAYITRPRFGVRATVPPAALPVPDSDRSATATTPPAGLAPIATRVLKWSVVTTGISTEALAPGETRN